MQQRSFLKASGIALGAGLAANSLLAKIPLTILISTIFGGGPFTSADSIRGPSLPTTIPAGFALPKGTRWKGLRLKAEIEATGQRYPVRWACR